MKKFALYTARFGTPGRFNIPDISIPDVDRFCFTDLNIQTGPYQADLIRQNRDIKSSFYQIRKMNLNPLTAIMGQRFVKVCIPDEIFDNYEYSIYVDCKRPIEINFDYLLGCLEPQSDFLTRRHPARDCIYGEGLYCISKKKGLKEDILKQLDFYRSENYPAHNGLYATGLLLRRHTKKVKEFSRHWWEQIAKFSYRDQISLPYVGWKYGMKISLNKRHK